MLVGLCRFLLRDAVEADDAVQQTFLSAQRALVGGAAPREPAAWLAAIARNECRARIRERMREPLAVPDWSADLAAPVVAAVDAADLDALWTALAALPRRQRNAFLLRELGGLSYRELGTALGVSRPAIESLLFRARQHLRNALAAGVAVVEPVARMLTAASPSATAKVAALTAGATLGALGVVALPRHERHLGPSRAVAPPVAVSRPGAVGALRSSSAARAPAPVPVASRPALRERRDDAQASPEHEQEAQEQEPEAQEQEPEAQEQEPEARNASAAVSSEGDDAGDAAASRGVAGDGGDEGSADSGDSGGGGD